MPVRKVSNHRGSAVGRFPSMKMQRMIAFESLIERDFIYLLDYDPFVTWFEEQPVRIEYEYAEKQLHYTPDFLLVEQKQQVLVECKPEKFVDTEENRRKFAVARQWCQGKGWQFRIVTEKEIRSGYRLQNVKLLTQYARQQIDPLVGSQILAVLRGVQFPISIGKVVQHVTALPPAEVTSHILHMAYHHQITLPIDQSPVSKETDISLCPAQQTGGEHG
jgi:hypothetical protein